HEFAFSDGALTDDIGPDGRTLTLVKDQSRTVVTTSVTESGGGTTAYSSDFSDPLHLVQTVAHPDGTENSATISDGGGRTITMADGTVSTVTVDSDPVYGMLAPSVRSTVALPISGLSMSVSSSSSIELGAGAEPSAWTSRTTSTTVNENTTTVTFDRGTNT